MFTAVVGTTHSTAEASHTLLVPSRTMRSVTRARRSLLSRSRGRLNNNNAVKNVQSSSESDHTGNGMTISSSGENPRSLDSSASISS